MTYKTRVGVEYRIIDDSSGFTLYLIKKEKEKKGKKVEKMSSCLVAKNLQDCENYLFLVEGIISRTNI